MKWGYALAQKEFNAQVIDKGPWCSLKTLKPVKKSSLKT